jgi:hypothetical protein
MLLSRYPFISSTKACRKKQNLLYILSLCSFRVCGLFYLICSTLLLLCFAASLAMFRSLSCLFCITLERPSSANPTEERSMIWTFWKFLFPADPARHQQRGHEVIFFVMIKGLSPSVAESRAEIVMMLLS